MEGLRLMRYDFDNYENHTPHIQKGIAYFVDDDNKTAYKKASDFICELPFETKYLGYDMEIYPKYELKKIDLT